jgi:hypothetical protein
MPIQEKDLGKYKRPDIYIEEIDNSIIELPAQNVLINLVPGFSKKGPVNRPVYVDNKVDFIKIFGDIDKQLENKGSYFHRTVLKMLETGPVWSLNLLQTVPNRDLLNFVSVSTSAAFESSDFTNQYKADYGRFFNRQDFWERDASSFLDLVNDPIPDNERLLHLTNMGDKTITTFIYKSSISGFDITASDWYGGDMKVPTFIHPKNLISDFLVNVLIVFGDWSDYKTLSVDSTWSNYFTIEGLKIESITDFLNESNVTLLGNYTASLIPNFKDINDNDMYIENVINNNTDKTNLFCTYNKDLLLDSDYLTNYIDLIGDSVVNTEIESINFLSYKQSIKEEKVYNNTLLDSPNNVFGTSPYSPRTNDWNNWSLDGIQYTTFTTTSRIVTYTNSNAYYIINGVQYDLVNGTKDIQLTDLASGYKRKDVLYLDSNGFNVMDGIAVLTGTTLPSREITFSNNNTIMLGTIEISNIGGTYSGTYTPITVNGSGFIAPSVVATTGITSLNETYVELTFNGTSGSTIRNYDYSRLNIYKIYNEIASQLQLNKGVIIKPLTPLHKTEIFDPTAISYTSTTNAKILIYISNPSNYVTGTNFLLYYKDNEFNVSAGATQLQTSYTGATNVVAKYSNYYLDYYNGEINNGDYFIDADGITKITLNMFVDSSGILTVNFDATTTNNSGITVKSDIGNWKQTVEIENISTITDMTNTNFIYVNKDRYSEVKKGYFLEAYYDEDYYSAPFGEGYIAGDTVPRKLTRIINVKNDSVNPDLKILYTDAPIKISINSASEYYTTTYPSIYNYVTTLKGISLKPFKIHADSIPNGTEKRQSDILDVFAKNTPLYKGLVNKNKIAWRYLIDSFGLGLDEQSKQQYVDLCGKKLNCLGFINIPSAKQFKKSSNPSFVNDDGSLNIEYIKKGGNEDKNPDFLYSFGTGPGRSTVGYFFPYVKVSDNGVQQLVPPAAYTATAYMRKFTTNTAGVYPWTIVAGISQGRLPDISGTEIDFTDDDLTFLTEMGANPVTFIRNVGYIINNDSTAQVFPVSSLSYIHSREVLIELENELYDMLLRYQWKSNTPNNRAEIKYRADRICQRFVDSYALYAYRNVCDTTNNTNYIIDLQGGVLDTHIEIVKGMGWIVNNITVEKTGTINSSGFQG